MLFPYTVQIEASDEARETWQAMAPAETIEADNPLDAARMTAANRTIADGDHWRVAVWEGADADTESTPVGRWYAADSPTRRREG